MWILIVDQINFKLKMLYIIGLGLGNKEDITIKGKKAIDESELIYLETYTSQLIQSSIEELVIFFMI